MLDRAFVGPGDQTGRPYIADHIAPDQVEAWAAAMLEGTEKDAGVKKKESPTIAGLLGYALGCVGMRLDDFERMTPDEFSAVCEAHAKTREADSRESWEQTRALAYTLSGPYMKHKTTVQRFWPLPWDEKKEKRGADRVVMSREEQKRRFEELARRG